jgi:hypothetical protein
MQDLAGLSQEFNFIVADPVNEDVYLDVERGWSLGPSGPWLQPRMLHLFQPGLESPRWQLARQVEAPIVRRMLAVERAARRSAWYWKKRERVELAWLRTRHRIRRLRPGRVRASAQRRLHGEPGPD